MKFSILKKSVTGSGRAGEISTSRGIIKTPVFMPVATRAAIRSLTSRDISELGFDIILSNTYHLYIRPGLEILEKAGGIHGFMNYNGPVLTDSGGFQVFSLAHLCKVKEHGVEFRSHLDGSSHLFTPEKVLDIQRVIGSDIMMVLDQCTDYPIDEKSAENAMNRTISWAKISSAYWNSTFNTDKQALFAIVQGSVYKNLRSECAARLVEMEFPGYAIGGLSVGEPKGLYREITEHTLQYLPQDKPRYMMGVGSPLEILYAVNCGVDMFDCVMPTRIARNGTLYTSKGRVNIKKSDFESDFTPLDPDCSCYVCKTFTKAYLRHIFKMGEISAMIYNTYHNLHFMKMLMDEIRGSIINGNFIQIYNKWQGIYSDNNVE
jgi:queuine tRNA-ribosyltransferase